MREITEEAVRMLATVDTTDECQVVLRLHKRKTVLTPGQAKEIGKALLAAELDAMVMRNQLDRDRAERMMAVKAGEVL